jgi:hypothetical protein
MDPLEKLPVKRMLAKDSPHNKHIIILCDGDYDGEWFSGFKWRITPQGYVQANVWLFGEDRRESVYLHHLVLPYKEGYDRTFKNGDHFDCRSANVIYRKHRDIMQDRSDRVRVKNLTAYWEKMRKLKEKKMDNESTKDHIDVTSPES